MAGQATGTRRGGWLSIAQLVTILTMWLIPAMGLAIFAFAARNVESAATRPAPPEYITVGSQAQGAPDAVAVQLKGSVRRGVTVPVAGVMVRPGDASAGLPVSDGQTLAQVGDRLLIANAGALPFYRALDRTSTGDDVARLNELLMALKLPAAEAGNSTRFTSQTAAGVRQLNRRIRSPLGDAFHPDSTVFVGPGAILSGFTPSIGDTLEQGGALATVVTAPQSITFISETSRNAIPWDYETALVEAADGSQVELHRDADADALASFGAFVLAHGTAPDQTRADGGDNVTPTLAGFRLSNAAASTVSLVPATSLHTSASGRTCVFAAPDDDDAVTPVAVRRTSPSNKAGVIETDAELEGHRIAVDVSRLPTEVLSRC